MEESKSNKYSFINLNYLQQLANNDGEFMKKIIDKVAAQIPDFIQQMEESLSKNELDKLRGFAHKMANSMLTLGIKKAENSLHLIEENIINNTNIDSLSELIIEVKEVCNKALIEMEQSKNDL